MKARIILMFNMLMISMLSKGQMAEYYFMQQTGTYTALTSETVLWSGTFDNAVSTIEIPSFLVNGTAYTSISVSTNGFVTFGGTVPSNSNYDPISGSGVYNVAISPFGENLQNAASGSPKISYNTNVDGEIVVQWQDIKRAYSAAADVASFQVRLNPSTGLISIVYGSVTTTYTGTSYGLQVGLRGTSNSDFNNRTTTTNWAATTAGSSYSATCRFNSTVYPVPGLTFTWKPLYNPTNFTAIAVSLSQIELSWQKNSLNHNVMLAYNTSATFGTPISGTTYIAGNPITGGGTVLFYGDGTSFSHTGLNPNTIYYYKIWSYDAVPDYSNGAASNTRTGYALPYLQNFPSTALPAEWSSDMSRTSNHGTSGSIGLNKRLYSATTTSYAIAPLVGSITSITHLSFHYRFVDYSGYPATATALGPDDKLDIQVSLDDGATFTTFHTIDQNNHIATTEFTNIALSLAAYSGDFIKIRFLYTWGSGDYYADIDNVLFEDGTDMSYTGSTTEQPNTSNIGIGSVDNDIIRLQVITQKNANPLSLTSITFNTTGTDNVSANLDSAKVYYTTTPVFSTSVKYGASIYNPSGTLTFTGIQALAQGNNYFWLAYDIKSAAISGNVVDAQCTGFITSESGNSKVPTITNPAGNRKIGTVFTGTKTIPGDYATLASAVIALNGGVVGTGGLTFNMAGDYIENTSAAIVLTATGTSLNPIVFKKSGPGNNPLITRTDAGSVNTTSIGNHGDGVIILEGSDYVTFDSIDIAASQASVEYGYYLRKASVTDGCKNVTIKNSNITMTKGASRYVIGFCAANNSASASNISVTIQNGAHQNIVFTGNTISNVFTGMWLKGHDTFFDQNFTIGISGAGNTIQNYAGNSAYDAYGIYLADVNNAGICYNSINNFSGGGTNFTSAGYGIYNAGLSGNSFYALYNNINISSQATAYGDNLYGIRSRVNGEVQVDYNTITLSNSIATGQSFYYISNEISTSSNVSFSISHNIFQGSDLNHTGTIYFINNVNSQQSPAVASILYNTTSGTINRTAASGSFYLYYNNGAPTGTEIIAGNNFSNISQSGTSAFYGITSNTNAANTHQVYENVIANITNGSGSFTAIDLGTSLTRHIYGNQIYNISTAGTGTMINIGSGLSTCHIYRNLITNISSSSTSTNIPVFNGILIPNGSSVYIYNNFISDLKTPASGSTDAIRAISITSSLANSLIGLYYNSIYLSATSSGSNFGTTGVYHTSSSNATTAQLDMRNNIIVNKSTPNGSGRTVVLRRNNSNLANFSQISDNNVLYAGTPGASRLIYYDAVGYQTLAAYQAQVTPREANSHSEDPPLVNVTTPPFDLHMQTSVPCLAESAGQVLSSPITINIDYDGDTREAAPDIGADEFDGISGFVSNPQSFTAATLSSQQIRLSFTANSSADDVVIVFNNTGTFTPPSGTPVINQSLAGGTVIYYGNTSPYDHSGLTTGTIYYYKAFSYNGASYSLGIAGNAAPAVNPVTNFSAIALNQNQVNLGWTKNNGGNDVIIASHSAYMSGNLVNGTVYNVGDPIPSGGSVIYKGSDTAFPHNGLTTWTQYYYKCWSFDSYNYYSSASTTNEVTYADTVTSLPYLMNFSGTWSHEPVAPPNWKVLDVGSSGTFTWVRYTTSYLSPPACVRGLESDIADDYLISPPMKLPAQDLQMSWYDKVTSASSNNSYKVLLSTTNNQISSFTTELGDYNCTNTAWTVHTIDLGDYQGQTVFIAFYHYYSQSQYQYFTIDDILIETLTPGAASLVFPVDDLLTYVNPLLKWTAPTASIPLSGYKVYLDTSPNPSTQIYNGQDLNFQPSGLLYNTTYYWKVVPYNTNGDAVNVPVWSFSTVRSAQLIESFEADYFPPVSWDQDFGWMYSVTSAIHGDQSAIRSTTTSPVKLITPLLDISAGDKLEFFTGTSSSTNLRIQILYSANGTSWTNLGDPIAVPAGSWGFNSVDLGSLAGNDYYLAFGAYYLSGGTSGNVFLDHVTGPDVVAILPSTATNPDPPDLDTYVPTAAVLSWDPVVWGGIPSGYKVYMDTSPNPATLVFNGSNEYFQAGPLLNSTAYYWQVIPYNSIGDAVDCPVWSFSTVPEGGVQIGRGTEDYLDLPIYPDYSYCYTQTIYLQSEIDISGSRISTIYYHWNGGEEGIHYKDWVIYMGHTTKTEFSSTTDWIPAGQMTLVFNGEVNIPEIDGWIEIVLDIPFEYNNTDNLVIAVDENTDGFAGGAISYFYGTNSPDARGIKYYDDITNPNPASPPAADHVVEGYANIRLQLEDIPTSPLLGVVPASRDFGDVPYGYGSSPQVFKIKNNGIGTLVITGVTKGGTDAGHFELSDANIYPVNLTANQSITVSVTFNPTNEGLNSANLSITHDAPGSPGIITLAGTGINPVISVFPFTETFENSSIYRIAWSQIQENGTGVWTYASGAGDGNITTAHDGVLNARFTSTADDNIAKLVSPVFNLTDVTNPRVVFWYGQQFWSPDQNELKIYYRTASDQPWVQIFHDFTNRSEWTSDSVILPNPAATYQIAFEGIDNYGYANVLDDVMIGPQPGLSTTWTGSVSTEWTNPANWSNGAPGSGYAVIISGGTHMPVITTTVTVVSVTIQTGRSIIISPTGNLTITGTE